MEAVSELKRYTLIDDGIELDSEGEWVCYEDVAKLEADNDRFEGYIGEMYSLVMEPHTSRRVLFQPPSRRSSWEQFVERDQLEVRVVELEKALATVRRRGS